MKAFASNTYVFLAVSCSLFIAACGLSEPRSIGVHTAADMLLQRTALMVDVRERDEWNHGNIEGAIHIPLGQIEARLSELEAYRGTALIVQCRSGRRSKEGYRILESAGFTDLYNLDGGINAWIESGFALKKL
jgi:rhodanese-related sulfurtransferase